MSHLFPKLADQILNQSQLVIANQKHRIAEIEFYLHCQEHLDVFTHRSKEQSTHYQWYFHKKGGTYKSGTFKGLDITFQPDDEKIVKGQTIYGGILIRSILKPDGSVLEGPCNVVNYILNLTQHDHIRDLVASCDDLNVDNVSNCFYLAKMEKLCYVDHIYSSPRVGLTLKNYQPGREKYLMARYRYLIFPEKYKKNRNLIALSLWIDCHNDDQVIEETRMKPTQFQNIKTLFQNGHNNKLSDYVNCNLSASQLVELYGWLHYKGLV